MQSLEHLSLSLKDRLGSHSTSTCFTISMLLAYKWADVTGLIILAMCAGNIKALV